ncbi:ARM repeat superfamily protein [Forsythia ovata]|uniref:ARM repeat superfamily protein n=1 Tax=Forsythia ovata TaxID=205694 RepID=A0ABD1QPR8_9LAMI
MKDDEKNVLAVLGRSNIAALVQLLTATSPRIREKLESREGYDFSPEVVHVSRNSRSIVGRGGVRPLIEICQTGDSVMQADAACTLKDISAVPEVRPAVSEEGIIKVMINLLDCGALLRSKEYAADCLQNLTLSNDNLRRCVISEGGIRSLLDYLVGPLPQESADGALRNLVGVISVDVLVSLGLLPRLVHVLKSGLLVHRKQQPQ